MTDLTTAYNEYIADYCEGHGGNKATRDEAHETADKLVQFGRSLGAAAKALGMSAADSDDVNAMIEAVDWDGVDDARIVALAASEALSNITGAGK